MNTLLFSLSAIALIAIVMVCAAVVWLLFAQAKEYEQFAEFDLTEYEEEEERL